MPDLVRDGWISGFVMGPLVPRRLRVLLLRLWGMDVGKATLYPRSFFGGPNIAIGDGSFLNFHCYLDNGARIEIGRNCHLGPGTTILTSDHEPGGAGSRAGTVVERPVTVGDGCWLGARVVVCPGVSVGDGCVVAAGAVVTRDCAPDGLYGGVPARRLRDLPRSPAAPTPGRPGSP